jgi:hypothetical protein
MLFGTAIFAYRVEQNVKLCNFWRQRQQRVALAAGRGYHLNHRRRVLPSFLVKLVDFAKLASSVS